MVSVSWQQLLAGNRVRAHTTNKQELDALRSVVERDLRDAALTDLSEDRRFATAYNAALSQDGGRVCGLSREWARRTPDEF